MSQYIQEFPSLLTPTHPALTKPVPSASTDGVDIATGNGTWFRLGRANIGFPMAVVFLSADGASTLTGPVIVYGFDGASGGTAKWFRIGVLNGGADIVLSSTVGYAEQFNFPCLFTRLAISAVVSANNVDDRYMPITSNL